MGQALLITIERILSKGVTEILKHEARLLNIGIPRFDVAEALIFRGFDFWPPAVQLGLRTLSFFFAVFPAVFGYSFLLYKLFSHLPVVSSLFGLFRIALVESIGRGESKKVEE